MARMYSRKKGKSGSTKPTKPQLQNWVRYKPKEIELLIVKLAKEGNTSSQIGLHLRDTYGIPDIKLIAQSSISEILKKKKLLAEIPEDLMFVLKRVVALQKHLETNKHDEVGKRGIILAESKVKRLVKYYKKTGLLAEDWKYDRKKVSLMIE
ncbi:MAG: 30S ribosomal protein S15 [Nanoarchaeota archaeon]|nr:30S ribosomal protein S15 [Nanoarchaeota archaeon]